MFRRFAVLAVASVCVLGMVACGDDDDEGGFGFPGQTTQPGQAGADPAAGGAAGAGYTQSDHDDFVNECANFPGASGDLCECAWGSITQSVPYADYQAFASGFANGSTALPEWLTAAVGSCG
jgi:hypothetical protein